MAAALLKLLDNLHLVAGNVLFIQQVDILDAAIVKHEIMDIVIMNLAGFIDDAIAGLIQKNFNETRPFTFGKLHAV
ncbi:hypothetical protein D3C71_1842340 [compost metagenome]